MKTITVMLFCLFLEQAAHGLRGRGRGRARVMVPSNILNRLRVRVVNTQPARRHDVTPPAGYTRDEQGGYFFPSTDAHCDTKYPKAAHPYQNRMCHRCHSAYGYTGRGIRYSTSASTYYVLNSADRNCYYVCKNNRIYADACPEGKITNPAYYMTSTFRYNVYKKVPICIPHTTIAGYKYNSYGNCFIPQSSSYCQTALGQGASQALIQQCKRCHNLGYSSPNLRCGRVYSKYYLANPMDHSCYYECNKQGQMYAKGCPAGHIYNSQDAYSTACVPVQAHAGFQYTTVGGYYYPSEASYCNTEYATDPVSRRLCRRCNSYGYTRYELQMGSLQNNLYYWNHPRDSNCYFMCNEHHQVYSKPCPPGHIYNRNGNPWEKTCIPRPTIQGFSYNMKGLYYYPEESSYCDEKYPIATHPGLNRECKRCSTYGYESYNLWMGPQQNNRYYLQNPSDSSCYYMFDERHCVYALPCPAGTFYNDDDPYEETCTPVSANPGYTFNKNLNIYLPETNAYCEQLYAGDAAMIKACSDCSDYGYDDSHIQVGTFRNNAYYQSCPYSNKCYYMINRQHQLQAIPCRQGHIYNSRDPWNTDCVQRPTYDGYGYADSNNFHYPKLADYCDQEYAGAPNANILIAKCKQCYSYGFTSNPLLRCGPCTNGHYYTANPQDTSCFYDCNPQGQIKALACQPDHDFNSASPYTTQCIPSPNIAGYTRYRPGNFFYPTAPTYCESKYGQDAKMVAACKRCNGYNYRDLPISVTTGMIRDGHYYCGHPSDDRCYYQFNDRLQAHAYPCASGHVYNADNPWASPCQQVQQLAGYNYSPDQGLYLPTSGDYCTKHYTGHAQSESLTKLCLRCNAYGYNDYNLRYSAIHNKRNYLRNPLDDSCYYEINDQKQIYGFGCPNGQIFNPSHSTRCIERQLPAGFQYWPTTGIYYPTSVDYCLKKYGTNAELIKQCKRCSSSYGYTTNPLLRCPAAFTGDSYSLPNPYDSTCYYECTHHHQILALPCAPGQVFKGQRCVDRLAYPGYNYLGSGDIYIPETDSYCDDLYELAANPLLNHACRSCFGYGLRDLNLHRDTVRRDHTYMAHPLDQNCYIDCDSHGKIWARPCPIGQVFNSAGDQYASQCVSRTAIEGYNYHDPGMFYYPTTADYCNSHYTGAPNAALLKLCQRCHQYGYTRDLNLRCGPLNQGRYYLANPIDESCYYEINDKYQIYALPCGDNQIYNNGDPWKKTCIPQPTINHFNYFPVGQYYYPQDYTYCTDILGVDSPLLEACKTCFHYGFTQNPLLRCNRHASRKTYFSHPATHSCYFMCNEQHQLMALPCAAGQVYSHGSPTCSAPTAYDGYTYYPEANVYYPTSHSYCDSILSGAAATPKEIELCHICHNYGYKVPYMHVGSLRNNKYYLANTLDDRCYYMVNQKRHVVSVPCGDGQIYNSRDPYGQTCIDRPTHTGFSYSLSANCYHPVNNDYCTAKFGGPNGNPVLLKQCIRCNSYGYKNPLLRCGTTRNGAFYLPNILDHDHSCYYMCDDQHQIYALGCQPGHIYNGNNPYEKVCVPRQGYPGYSYSQQAACYTPQDTKYCTTLLGNDQELIRLCVRCNSYGYDGFNVRSQLSQISNAYYANSVDNSCYFMVTPKYQAYALPCPAGHVYSPHSNTHCRPQTVIPNYTYNPRSQLYIPQSADYCDQHYTGPDAGQSVALCKRCYGYGFEGYNLRMTGPLREGSYYARHYDNHHCYFSCNKDHQVYSLACPPGQIYNRVDPYGDKGVCVPLTQYPGYSYYDTGRYYYPTTDDYCTSEYGTDLDMIQACIRCNKYGYTETSLNLKPGHLTHNQYYFPNTKQDGCYFKFNKDYQVVALPCGHQQVYNYNDPHATTCVSRPTYPGYNYFDKGQYYVPADHSYCNTLYGTDAAAVEACHSCYNLGFNSPYLHCGSAHQDDHYLTHPLSRSCYYKCNAKRQILSLSCGSNRIYNRHGDAYTTTCVDLPVYPGYDYLSDTNLYVPSDNSYCATKYPTTGDTAWLNAQCTRCFDLGFSKFNLYSGNGKNGKFYLPNQLSSSCYFEINSQNHVISLPCLKGTIYNKLNPYESTCVAIKDLAGFSYRDNLGIYTPNDGNYCNGAYADPAEASFCSQCHSYGYDSVSINGLVPNRQNRMYLSNSYDPRCYYTLNEHYQLMASPCGQNKRFNHNDPWKQACVDWPVPIGFSHLPNTPLYVPSTASYCDSRYPVGTQKDLHQNCVKCFNYGFNKINLHASALNRGRAFYSNPYDVSCYYILDSSYQVLPLPCSSGNIYNVDNPLEAACRPAPSYPGYNYITNDHCYFPDNADYCVKQYPDGTLVDLCRKCFQWGYEGFNTRNVGSLSNGHQYFNNPRDQGCYFEMNAHSQLHPLPCPAGHIFHGRRCVPAPAITGYTRLNTGLYYPENPDYCQEVYVGPTNQGLATLCNRCHAYGYRHTPLAMNGPLVNDQYLIPNPRDRGCYYRCDNLHRVQALPCPPGTVFNGHSCAALQIPNGYRLSPGYQFVPTSGDYCSQKYAGNSGLIHECLTCNSYGYDLNLEMGGPIQNGAYYISNPLNDRCYYQCDDQHHIYAHPCPSGQVYNHDGAHGQVCIDRNVIPGYTYHDVGQYYYPTTTTYCTDELTTDEYLLKGCNRCYKHGFTGANLNSPHHYAGGKSFALNPWDETCYYSFDKKGQVHSYGCPEGSIYNSQDPYTDGPCVAISAIPGHNYFIQGRMYYPLEAAYCSVLYPTDLKLQHQCNKCHAYGYLGKHLTCAHRIGGSTANYQANCDNPSCYYKCDEKQQIYALPCPTGYIYNTAEPYGQAGPCILASKTI